MKANEIITLSPVTVSSKTFKDKRLQDAYKQISSIYRDAVSYAQDKNREVAKILARVADEKSYEKDGFKSVADFANSTFGIARQNAYALASAGKVYNDEKAPEGLKALTPSKLAEVASLPADTLKNAVETGAISVDKTQKELREFATAAKGEGKAIEGEVIEQYTARPCVSIMPDNLASELAVPRIPEEWDKFFVNYVASMTGADDDTVETVKLTKGKAAIDSKKATINRRLYFNRSFSIVVEFFKYNPNASHAPIEPKEEPREYTIEELEAMLAAKKAEQGGN